jgi:hypothetical protein
MSRVPQPALLARMMADAAGFASQHGFIFNAASAVAGAAIGLGLVLQHRRLLRPVVILTAIACLADWVLVQDLGFLGGVGTDPNSMLPLLLLVTGGYLAVTRPAQAAEQAAPARPRIVAAFAGLSARGLLALWAASLVAIPLGPR